MDMGISMYTFMLNQPWQVRMVSVFFAIVSVALLCCIPGSSPVGARAAQVVPRGPDPASCGFEWNSTGAEVALPYRLHDIAAISANDVWAVGEQTIPNSTRVVLEHWDGSEWSLIPAGAIDGEVNSLSVVSAIAADDVWAFGSSETEDVVPVHWDGSTWQTRPGPVVGLFFDDGVAISDSDLWLVGNQIVSGHIQSYATHWNGQTWTTMPVPGGIHADSYLTAVAAVAPDDVWVTGRSSDGVSGVAFTSRWDGSNWYPVPLPPLGSASNLADIAALASGDVWAVGSYYDTKGHGIVLHWDGTAWVEEPAPDNSPQAVVALAPYDVWAIGTGPYITAVHWNGYEWVAEAGPDITPNILNLAVTGVLPGELWTAVTDHAGHITYGRIDHYRESFVAYTDVAEDAEFFPYIKCLSCADIVSGYPCGGSGEPCNGMNDPYFRPAASVTRGQLAKIVAGAAGLGGSPVSQTFEDVPPGSTFYPYVETLAFREIMSGYPCGGPNEPCVPPDDRPYFRPNATASRGQLAKIAANAAGFTDPIPPGTQTFADVPEGSTFYLYIERLGMRDVMQGYPCGGVGEPCDPENRPYFRPGNTVTRGQAAKIVSNTFVFVLNCQPADAR